MSPVAAWRAKLGRQIDQSHETAGDHLPLAWHGAKPYAAFNFILLP